MKNGKKLESKKQYQTQIPNRPQSIKLNQTLDDNFTPCTLVEIIFFRLDFVEICRKVVWSCLILDFVVYARFEKQMANCLTN